MGWSIGFDSNWNRDIGYGVPAICDHPKCDKKIDRGLSYVCGSDPYGGEYGCGLYFCGEHLIFKKPHGSDRTIEVCSRCYRYRPSYQAKSDCQEWIDFKMTDDSWKKWREEQK